MNSTGFSILIPIYNEEKTLGDIISRVSKLPRVSQIIFVNDGSQDRSGQILRELLELGDSRFVCVTLPKNKGKGAAIQSGLTMASARFMVIQDADLEYNPDDLQLIFDLLEDGKTDVVFGSRFLKPNPNLYKTYLWGNKFMTMAINIFGRGRLTDSYTCYKGMSVQQWKNLSLNSSGFEIEAEIAIKALLKGLTIKEVPIGYAPRSMREGKKIRAKDALLGLLKVIVCVAGHVLSKRTRAHP